MPDDETFEIGYREDAVFWVTESSNVPDAAAAEQFMQDDSGDWRVDAEVFLGPTGEMVNSKDEEWAECAADAPGARRGWRLVNTAQPEIEDEWGDLQPNPHYQSPESRAEEAEDG